MEKLWNQRRLSPVVIKEIFRPKTNEACRGGVSPPALPAANDIWKEFRMFVYLVALLQALLYLLSIPVNLAVRVKGLKAGTGLAVFDGIAARRRAARSLSSGNDVEGKGPGFREIWPILRRMRFDRVELVGRVSLGDAAATALLCGGLNGLGRSLAGRAERLRVDVRPVFSDELAFELRGMLRARTGQIMLAVLRTMKGRIHPWTSIRLKAS